MRTIGNIERFLVIGIVVVIGAILAVAIKGADDLEGAYKKQVEAKQGGVKKGGGTALSKTDPMRGAAGPVQPTTKSEAPDKGAERGALGTDAAHFSAALEDILNRKKHAESGQPQPAAPPDGTLLKPDGDPSGAGPRPDADSSAPVVIKDDPKGIPDPSGSGGAPAGDKVGADPAKVGANDGVSPVALAWTYEVQPGDRLERIAATLYGERSMWKQILEANPAFTDPTRIRAGSILTLPKEPVNTTAPGLAHGATKTPAVAPDAPHDAKVVENGRSVPDATTPVADSAKGTTYKRVTTSDQYEVKKGDTLMAIAAMHYGTRAAWRMILGANAERIADKDHIKPGTVLKLPAQ